MTERIERQGRGRRKEDQQECDGVCNAHSGTVTGIKGLYAMLTVLIGLIGTQMMFQIPAIKLDILNEVKGVTARIVELEKKDIEFASKLGDLDERLKGLETRKGK